MSENRRKTRTICEYFSPNGKVKESSLHSLRQRRRTSQLETPMKPSQVPNRLAQPPPRRTIPLRSPEHCHSSRPHPQLHPPPAPGSIHSLGLVACNPAKVGSSDVGHSVHTVQPQSCVPSLTPKMAEKAQPPFLANTKSWSPGNIHLHGKPAKNIQSPDRNRDPFPQNIPSTVADNQIHTSRGHKETLSSQKSSQGGVNCSFLKRRSDSEGSDSRVKRCPQDTSYSKAQMPNCPPGQSLYLLLSHNAEKHKTTKIRKTSVIPNDLDELFTPDPITYVVNSKAATPTSATTPVKSPCRQSQSSTGSPPSKALGTKMTLPSTLPGQQGAVSHDFRLISDPVRQLSNEGARADKALGSHVAPQKLRQSSDDTFRADDSAASCSPSTSGAHRQEWQCEEKMDVNNPLDLQLGLGLSLGVDLDQSSQSSEDEPLLSLQEMMQRVAKPPDTPEKGALPEPTTPILPRRHSKPTLQSRTKAVNYKNNLDQMLKEIHSNKRCKEEETKILSACEEDLLRIAEYEEAEENQGEVVLSEQQEFVQRFSVSSGAIRDVHPGEVVFDLDGFGRFFSQDTLQLRQCRVEPQGAAQKTLIWSSPAQLRLHVVIGLFQEAYDSLPCPPQVTGFLFKMMSVHTERLVSQQILHALLDIACTAAYQIVKNGCQKFEVWVPSVTDVSRVLLNMGVSFVSLFPLGNLQPPFTEGDLLDDIFSSDSDSGKQKPSTFPEHNYSNILKYLTFCLGISPRAYSDPDLLLLLAILSRMGLEAQLALHPNLDLFSAQCHIVDNIRDWEGVLPRMCLALCDLTEDHHNMCWLLQLLPDHQRGKQLRRHLSLCMISKLLDGSCTYRPSCKEFQFSDLLPYLPRMQPSSLLRAMQNSSNRKRKEQVEDSNTLDQQTYYLCYSLLTLVNEASNYHFSPPEQKKHLMLLSSELERHIKCDIRESEKCLYRSKVKDLVARIYNKWQMLLSSTKPLNDQLYDYWQPPPGDTLSSSQAEETTEESDDGMSDPSTGEQGALTEDEDEEFGPETVVPMEENE